MRRSKNVSYTRQDAGRCAMGVSKQGLRAATALFLLVGVPQLADAQSGSGSSSITINRDVIESLDSQEQGHGQEQDYQRSSNFQQQTTPWGTPLPGSPFARLPNRSTAGGPSATGGEGLAFPPRENPRSTLLIGGEASSQGTSASRTTASQEQRNSSAADRPEARPQESARPEAPSEPARGKPRSVLSPEETETQETETTETGDSERDSELHSDERTTTAPDSDQDPPESQNVSSTTDESASSTAGDDEAGKDTQAADSSEPRGRDDDATAQGSDSEAESATDEEDSQATASSSESTSEETTTEAQTSVTDADPTDDDSDESTSASSTENTTEVTEASETDSETTSQPDSETTSNGQVEESQQASRPDEEEAGEIGEATLEFTSESADLSEEARRQLSELAGQLSDDSSMRIQLLAYAEGSEEDASQARRLSLSRALAVRAFLLDHGIRSTRIDVRALGPNAPGNGPVNRVDIVPEDADES